MNDTPGVEGRDDLFAAKRRKPTPKQLVDAQEIVRRYAESLDDETCQEYSMALYVADNMAVSAIAEEARRAR